MNILFVTWDGPQVNYLEGLYLPIFGALGAAGFRFHVLQFTWADPRQVAQTRGSCEALGVSYQVARVWRRPTIAAGSAAAAVWGGRLIQHQIQRHQVDALMPRSIMPALSVLAADPRQRVRVIFDADGLAIDEKVDFAGLSPDSVHCRLLRDIEAKMVRRAAVVLTRSAKAAQILANRAGAGSSSDKFRVVGNGRDASLFGPRDPSTRAVTRQALGIGADAPLVAYVGSLGPQYCIDEMVQFFAHVRRRRQDARMLVLSSAADHLVAGAAAAGIPREAFVAQAVEPSAVAGLLACADLGVALRAPSFSMQGVAPIKLGEYLLCGVPVLASAGVGGSELIGPEVGRLLPSSGSLETAAEWFVGEVLEQRERLRARCRAVGLEHFSLAATVDAYRGGLDVLRS